MSANDPAEDLAFRLLMNGPITLFYRRRVLDEATRSLQERGCQIIVLDAASWANTDDLHRDIARTFRFPDYYGNNFDALNDCFSDVVVHDYGWDPSSAGLVLVLTGYDTFAAEHHRPAQQLLDIIATNSRLAALRGSRFLCLVQIDDPRIVFEPVGSTPVAWNESEWLESQRPAPGHA